MKIGWGHCCLQQLPSLVADRVAQLDPRAPVSTAPGHQHLAIFHTLLRQSPEKLHTGSGLGV